MAGETPPAVPAPENPFDFTTQTGQYEPALAAKAVELQEKIKTVFQASPELAASLLGRIEEEIAKKKSATETLDFIFGAIGKVVGFIK